MFSIVIPAYNAQAHILRALESIAAQSYGDFEILVVDDGSTDRTAELVSRWSDKRVQLIQQSNAGVSAARNRGIKEAKGTWIAFLDADDRWQPSFLETVASTIRQFSNAVAIFTNFEDSVSGKRMIGEVGGGARLLPNYFDFVLKHGQGMWTSASVIRRDVLVKVGGFPVGVTHGEDLDTWARVAWTGQVVYVPDVLAVYHTETEGSATKVPLAQSLRYPEVVKTYRKWRDAGKIPAPLIRSSEAYAQRQLYAYVGGLLRVGARTDARRVLSREARISFEPWRYALYWLASLLPTKAYNLLRARLVSSSGRHVGV